MPVIGSWVSETAKEGWRRWGVEQTGGEIPQAKEEEVEAVSQETEAGRTERGGRGKRWKGRRAGWGGREPESGRELRDNQVSKGRKRCRGIRGQMVTARERAGRREGMPSSASRGRECQREMPRISAGRA